MAAEAIAKLESDVAELLSALESVVGMETKFRNATVRRMANTARSAIAKARGTS